MLLAGEWIPAEFFMSVVFLVGAGGCVLLGWYVLRGDRMNRAHEGHDEIERVIDSATGHPRSDDH